MSFKRLIILKGLVMGDEDKKDLKLEKKRIKAEAKASKVGMSFLSGTNQMVLQVLTSTLCMEWILCLQLW